MTINYIKNKIDQCYCSSANIEHIYDRYSAHPISAFSVLPTSQFDGTTKMIFLKYARFAVAWYNAADAFVKSSC